MEKKEIYDTVIIGGGPAGLTAAIYTGRRALKTLVLTSDIGGQIAKTTEVENYPGLDMTTGIDLSMAFYNQAKKFGAKFVFEEAIKITKPNEMFEVSTRNNSIQTKTIILAFGKRPRHLDVPGEDRLLGHGVTYCATCDAPFFKDKVVTIVGGGNSALSAAILLSSYARKVYLIHRGDSFRAEQFLVDKVKNDPKIELLMESNIETINGSDRVKSVTLTNKQEVETDGVIIEIGFSVDRSIVKGLVKTDKKNQIKANQLQETSVPGIFAAGDLTTTPYKQVVISAGEGAKAALACFDYLQRLEGKKGIIADWH